MFPGERQLHENERDGEDYLDAAESLRDLIGRAAAAYDIRMAGATYVARPIGSIPRPHYIWDAPTWIVGVGIGPDGYCNFMPYVAPPPPPPTRQLRVGDLIRHVRKPMVRRVDVLHLSTGRVEVSELEPGPQSKPMVLVERPDWSWREVWVFDNGTKIPDVRNNSPDTAIPRESQTAWDRLLDD